MISHQSETVKRAITNETREVEDNLERRTLHLSFLILYRFSVINQKKNETIALLILVSWSSIESEMVETI